MRVSEQGKQPVRPRDFWTAVGIVSLLLGGMGLYQMQTGHLPATPRWADWVQLAFLGIGWIAYLYRLLRYRRKGVFLPFLLFLIGYTLTLSDKLLPHLGSGEGTKMIGALLMGFFWLSLFVDFGKRRPNERVSDG